jgi:hypothetical protein
MLPFCVTLISADCSGWPLALSVTVPDTSPADDALEAIAWMGVIARTTIANVTE